MKTTPVAWEVVGVLVGFFLLKLIAVIPRHCIQYRIDDCGDSHVKLAGKCKCEYLRLKSAGNVSSRG